MNIGTYVTNEACRLTHGLLYMAYRWVGFLEYLQVFVVKIFTMNT